MAQNGSITEELEQERIKIGEPEPQDHVALDHLAHARLGYSNDWKKSDLNSRINRGILEAQGKSELEISKVLEPYTKQMEVAVLGIAAIDKQYPEARGRAKEINATQTKARERLKSGNLIECPRCKLAFTEFDL